MSCWCWIWIYGVNVCVCTLECGKEARETKIVFGDHILLTIINALQTDIDMTWETMRDDQQHQLNLWVVLWNDLIYLRQYFGMISSQDMKFEVEKSSRYDISWSWTVGSLSENGIKSKVPSNLITHIELSYRGTRRPFLWLMELQETVSYTFDDMWLLMVCPREQQQQWKTKENWI